MSKQKAKPAPSPKPTTSTSDFFDRVEVFIDKNRFWLLSLIVLIAALFGFWRFNPQLSFATDDAGYIRQAYDFVHRGNYPNYQGPFWPLMMSPFLAIFGVSLTLFKALCLACYLGFLLIFYWAFYKRVPNLVLFVILFTFSINPYYHYYSNFTFNEACMFLVQASVFAIIFKNLDKLENNSLKETWLKWLVFALLLLILSITKTVAVIAFMAFVVYFLVNKKWLQAAYAFGSFVLVTVVYRALLAIFFNIGASNQFDQQMRVDFYDASKGYEDLAGYMDRFYVNFGNYVSVHFYKILGIRGPQSIAPFSERVPEQAQASAFFSILFIVLSAFSLWYLYKRNRFAFICLLYSAAILIVSLIALQTFWNQDRLIAPYIPVILVGFYTAFYLLLKDEKLKLLQLPFFLGIMIIAILQLPLSVKMGKSISQLRTAYKKGNTYVGMSPATANMAHIATYAGDNASDASLLRVACNKPEEAFIYARKGTFFRMPKMTNKTADEVLAELQSKNTSHLILDRLGSSAGGVFQPIYSTYPEKLELVAQVGEGENIVYLFKINY